MPSQTDFTAIMLEKVLPTIQVAYDKIPHMAVSVIEGDAPVESMSKRDARLPVEVIPGSDYRVFNPDGGALGLGSGPVEVVQTINYISTLQALQVTFEAQMVTKTREQAIKQALARGLENAMKEAKEMDNIAFHASPDGAAQGLIGFATATNGTTVYTFADNATTGLGVNLMRINQKVHVYDTTLATWRTSAGAVRIVSVNRAAKQITLASAITGAAATDKFAFDGETATPAHKFGLFYYHNDATSGNLLALSRSTYPSIVANSVDAASSLLVPEHLTLLQDGILAASGSGLEGTYEGFCHPCQRARIKSLQLSISELNLTGPSTEIVDMVPRSREAFIWGDVKWWVDIRMPRTRMDIVQKGNWGRVSPDGGKIDYVRNADGKMCFGPMSTSDGSPLAADLYYLQKNDNWFCRWAGLEGYIKSLAVPSGY